MNFKNKSVVPKLNTARGKKGVRTGAYDYLSAGLSMRYSQIIKESEAIAAGDAAARAKGGPPKVTSAHVQEAINRITKLPETGPLFIGLHPSTRNTVVAMADQFGEVRRRENAPADKIYLDAPDLTMDWEDNAERELINSVAMMRERMVNAANSRTDAEGNYVTGDTILHLLYNPVRGRDAFTGGTPPPHALGDP